jgi:SulP family sulfate permease
LHHFLHLVRRAPRADVGILLITFALTVFADLVVAVNVGVVLASLLFMRRMAHAVAVQEEPAATARDAQGQAVSLPADTLVYSIDGPFFFGAAEKLEHTLESIQSHMGTVVLRMERVPFMDATGIQTLDELIDDFHRHKTRIVLVGLRPNVREKLVRAGLVERLGSGNLYDDLAAFAASQDAP